MQQCDGHQSTKLSWKMMPPFAPIKTTDHWCFAVGRTCTSRRLKLQHLDTSLETRWSLKFKLCDIYKFRALKKSATAKSAKEISVLAVLRDGALSMLNMCVCVFRCFSGDAPTKSVTQNNLCQHARVPMIATAQGKLDVACLKDNISSGLVLSRNASGFHSMNNDPKLTSVATKRTLEWKLKAFPNSINDHRRGNFASTFSHQQEASTKTCKFLENCDNFSSFNQGTANAEPISSENSGGWAGGRSLCFQNLKGIGERVFPFPCYHLKRRTWSTKDIWNVFPSKWDMSLLFWKMFQHVSTLRSLLAISPLFCGYLLCWQALQHLLQFHQGHQGITGSVVRV